MLKILDVSHYNTVTDWAKVKNAVDGVMLRVGYRGYSSGKIVMDNKFREYATACKKVGLPFGVYFMSQAITEAEGEAEATYSVTLAKEYGATLPTVIDSEDGDGTARVVRADGLSKAARTSIVKAFCKKVIALGYKTGVYASESWFTSRLNYNELTDYFIWVADYGKNTGVKNSSITLKKYDMHQYTSRATVAGVSGRCDMSECYVDFKTGASVSAGTVASKTEEVYDMPTIKKGSKGKAVKIWQIILGFTGVELDGDFGKKTDAATREWQEKNGLAVDGIVGKNSWKAGLESV